MFIIQKEVPLPKRTKGKEEYPFDKMDIGDSFLFDKEYLNNIHYVKARFTARTGKKYSVRNVDEKYYRCWRIE